MKIFKKSINELNNISVFIYGYFILGLLLSIFIGANVKLTVLPILTFILFLVGFCFSKLPSNFSQNFNFPKIIQVLCMINALVFLTGKIENESHFFLTLKGYIGFNVKIPLIMINIISILLFILNKKNKSIIIGYFTVFTLLTFISIDYFRNSNPRYDAISVTGYLFSNGANMINLSNYLIFLILGVIYFVFYKTKNYTPFLLIKYFILVLFSIFILSKQAFDNYYYNIILLSICYIIIYFFSCKEKSILLSNGV